LKLFLLYNHARNHDDLISLKKIRLVSMLSCHSFIKLIGFVTCCDEATTLRDLLRSRKISSKIKNWKLKKLINFIVTLYHC